MKIKIVLLYIRFSGEKYIMAQSIKSFLWKTILNFYPVIRRTGASITYLSDDWREIRIKLPFNRKTKNGFGTTYGGTIFSAIDAFHGIMLHQILEGRFVVLDKEANIRFIRPGQSTLYANIVFDDEEIKALHKNLSMNRKIDRLYNVDWKDKDGIIYSSIEKTVHVRHK